MNLLTPLTNADIEVLDDFLMSDATGDHAMDISMLDGFLTALVIGPHQPSPQQWFPKVWGTPDMAWSSAEEAERMSSLVLRHMHSINACFQTNPEAFEPLTYFRDNEGQEEEVIDGWCQGFVHGMLLDQAAWEPLLESDAHEAMLLPLMLFGTVTGQKQLTDNPGLAERRPQFADTLADCIRGIHLFWQPYQQAKGAVRTVQHEGPTIGRNDPCPCGSGKKYKKCCGSADKAS